jgi:hypothetical protein
MVDTLLMHVTESSSKTLRHAAGRKPDQYGRSTWHSNRKQATLMLDKTRAAINQ